MPAPGLLAEVLAETTEWVTVSVPPMNCTPPPGLLVVVGAEPFAWLPVMTLFRIVSRSPVDALPEPAMMPAPPKVLSAPPVIVRPETVPLTPPTTPGSKSRTRLLPFPSMTVDADPAPRSVMASPGSLPSASSPSVSV